MASRLLKQKACQSEQFDNTKQKQSVVPRRLLVTNLGAPSNSANRSVFVHRTTIRQT